jgi:hypothetical protein
MHGDIGATAWPNCMRKPQTKGLGCICAVNMAQMLPMCVMDLSAALQTHQGSWGGPNRALCPGAHWASVVVHGNGIQQPPDGAVLCR